ALRRGTGRRTLPGRACGQACGQARRLTSPPETTGAALAAAFRVVNAAKKKPRREGRAIRGKPGFLNRADVLRICSRNRRVQFTPFRYASAFIAVVSSPCWPASGRSAATAGREGRRERNAPLGRCLSQQQGD